jgi:Flp pilus assembly protein TadG
MIAKIIKNLSSRNRNEGSVALEFALIAPIYALCFLGTVEFGNFILVQQKLDKTTSTIADVVSQEETISCPDVDQVMSAIDSIAWPNAFSQNGKVILSSVSNDSNGIPRVNWQYFYNENLMLSNDSKIGESVGDEADMPDGFTLGDDETVIIAEVYYEYQTFIAPDLVADGEVLYKVSMFRPRLGALTEISGCPSV